MEIRYLTLAQVVALHEQAMLLAGQQPAALVREGDLDRAVHHPRVLAWYQGASLAEQAVDLAMEIGLAHAWVDGNKRTAVISLFVFLKANGVGVIESEFRRTFSDAFVATIGAKPEERASHIEGLVRMVESWMES